jgi:hypothetical protein
MGVSAVLVVVILTAGQGYSDDPLSGRWEGKPPRDGTLELNLNVKDGKIDGEGRIRLGGRKSVNAAVSGSVEGNKVSFQTQFPQTTVTYNCVWDNADALQCKTRTGYETTFTRVK